jgi:hypothetical protein
MAEKHREKRGMDNDCREQRAFEKSQWIALEYLQKYNAWIVNHRAK